MNEFTRWIVLGEYSVITYLVSLRGTEVFLLGLGGLQIHKLNQGHNKNYFLIP
jgi:hypothetical protein